MEDQEGGLAAREEARPPVAAKAGRKRRLTVMIMGSVGKVRSFQISTRFLVWAVLFFVAYIAVSLYAINSYIQLRQSSDKQSERARQAEEEASAAKRNLLRSRQHVALLEDYIRRMESGTEQAPGAPKEPSPEEAPKAAKSKPPAAAGPVDVIDMVIQKEGARIMANFKLVNTQPGEGAVGGYVHLIAVNRKAAPPREWTYPPEKLEKGFPVNYRNGHIFLINRFKQIQARFHLGSASESASVLRLLVYDQAGDIILQKEFEVGDAS
ncbi:MAG: hypothetical protein AB1512_32225 [Thermodesulfobacteriota bacterium]